MRCPGAVSLLPRLAAVGQNITFERHRELKLSTVRYVKSKNYRTNLQSVLEWIKKAILKSDDYLFHSRIHDSPHIITRQYARIVEKRVTSIGLNPADYGTHSFRQTQASLI